MTTLVIDRCSKIDPTLSCLQRYEAQMRGSFWPTPAGWLWSGSTDVLKSWTSCPYCGAAIPELTTAMLRTMDAPYEDEDGG